MKLYVAYKIKIVFILLLLEEVVDNFHFSTENKKIDESGIENKRIDSNENNKDKNRELTIESLETKSDKDLVVINRNQTGNAF